VTFQEGSAIAVAARIADGVASRAVLQHSITISGCPADLAGGRPNAENASSRSGSASSSCR